MFVQILCIEAHFRNILSKTVSFMTCLLIFFNLSMLTSRTTMFKNNRAKLAKLFMFVILIGLFFRQWFTYFCDIYVFLLQFRRRKKNLFLNPQFPFKVGLNGAMCSSLLMFAIEKRVSMGDLWLRR